MFFAIDACVRCVVERNLELTLQRSMIYHLLISKLTPHVICELYKHMIVLLQDITLPKRDKSSFTYIMFLELYGVKGLGFRF